MVHQFPSLKEIWIESFTNENFTASEKRGIFAADK